MQISLNVVMLIVVLVIVVMILIGKYALKCGETKEGYRRSSLGQQCGSISRSPVDYAFEFPNGGATRNPHFRSNPSMEYQPLDQGAIDMYRYSRNREAAFQQYRHDYPGPGGIQDPTLTNDSKGRMDYTDAGDVGLRRLMDNVHSIHHGPVTGVSNTELDRSQPDLHVADHRKYGGHGYFSANVYGD